MGLFSKKKEAEENRISQEVLDSIHFSTLDYVPGYKVVKSFGLVATWCDNNPLITGATNELKTFALEKYPECNAIIGTNSNLSTASGSTTALGTTTAFFRHAVFFAGTAVRIEPES